MPSKKQSYIGLEVEQYGLKVKEFQDYLKEHPVSHIDDPKTRVQEITLQINMMEKLGPMLQNLNMLRENKADQQKFRGGASANMLMDEE